MTTITALKARQIINSRGVPAVELDMSISDGSMVRASSPSGASVGTYESVDLYDNGPSFFGKSVQKAIENIRSIIAPALIGKDPTDQKAIDDLLIQLDGTPNEAKLGTNAVLAVSSATVKAGAAAKKIPVYQHIRDLCSPATREFAIPVPMFNVINGGAHADNNIAIQEFMVVPKGLPTYAQQLEAGAEIYHTLKGILKDKGIATGVGDEGGFAPNFTSDIEAILVLLDAIGKAGYKAGQDVFIALDVAISQFAKKQSENLTTYAFPHQGVSGTHTLTNSQDIIAYYKALVTQFPIMSIEDGLGEEDWVQWDNLTTTLNETQTISVGDDFIVTNPQRLQRAITEKSITGLIIKPNQIGTVSEVLEVVKLCDQNSIIKIASHRSGETGDTFIAQLAVGIHAQYLKDGATARSERVEKYNELLRIEEELHN